MYQFINDYNTIISFLSSIFTIIATFIALITILIWKKQQKFSIKINLLMDLEDSYEILFTKYIEEYHFTLRLLNTVKTNKTQSNQEINKLIDKELATRKENELSISGQKYELSFIRAIRFFPELDKYDFLKKSYLDKVFEKNLQELSSKILNTDAEKIAIDYFKELLEIKKDAIKKITKLRKAL